jgi:hypothetical protein
MSFFYFSINNTMLRHTLVVEQVIQMCTYFQKLKLVDFGARSIFLTNDWESNLYKNLQFWVWAEAGSNLFFRWVRNLFLNNFLFFLFSDFDVLKVFSSHSQEVPMGFSMSSQSFRSVPFRAQEENTSTEVAVECRLCCNVAKTFCMDKRWYHDFAATFWAILKQTLRLQTDI